MYNLFVSSSVTQHSGRFHSKYGLARDYIQSIYVSWAGTQVPFRPFTARCVDDVAEFRGAATISRSVVFTEHTHVMVCGLQRQRGG